jgi:leucyl-tRNA synthetase
LWKELGHERAVIDERWPQVDADALVRDAIEVVVQVNGKKRATVLLPVDASQALAEERALADEHVARFLEGQTVRKVIVVPGRLVNIVAN